MPKKTIKITKVQGGGLKGLAPLHFIKQKIHGRPAHAAFFIFIFVLSLYFVFNRNLQNAFSATFTFVQNSWSGGVSLTAVATHPGDATGWNKFYSKDVGVTTSVANSIRLVSSTYSSSVSSTFISGTASNTYFTSGTIKLLKLVGATCTVATECSSGGCENSVCYTPPCGSATSTLYSGQTYNLVNIGTQCWFAQHLNVGTMLASVATMPSNNSLIEKWCYNNDTNICATDGGFYTWAEALQLDPTCNTGSCTPSVNQQGICPTAWHVPTDAEYETLVVYLGTNQGTKLKVGGSSGFQGILSGDRGTGGTFDSRGTYAYLRSASQDTLYNAWTQYLYSGAATVTRYSYTKEFGFAVRCLKN